MKKFQEKKIKDLKKINGGEDSNAGKVKKTHYKENIFDGVFGIFFTETDLGFTFFA